MRWLGRLGCVGIVLLALAWVLSTVGVKSLDDIKPAQSGANTSNAFPVLAYALSKDVPMEFPLNGAGTAVRLISNAVLEDGSPTGESARHGYTVSLQFIDRQGVVIDSQNYAHRTRMEWVKDAEANGEPISVTVLEDGRSLVTGSRVVRMPLTGRDDARALRVSLVSKDDTVDGVLVRFYQHEAVLQHQLDRLWHRLKLHARKRLAQASVYGQSRSLLTDTEKRNLMRNRWRPGGPRDNRVKPTRLFVWRDATQTGAEDVVGASYGALPAFDRVLVSDGRPQEWQLQTDRGTSPGKVELHYDWVGDQRWQTASASITTDSEGRAMIQLPPGVVTVYPQPGHNLRTYVIVNGEKIEQAAQMQRVRSFVLNEQNPTLRYAISHIPNHKTPFRLDLRQPVDSTQPLDPTTVTVTLRDQSGSVIADPYVDSHDSQRSDPTDPTVTVSLTIPAQVSRLDRRVMMAGFGAVSERIQQFWALPPEVAWVDVQARGDALVSAYTRPDDLPHRRQIAPEAGPEDDRMPIWFALLPGNSDDLKASGHQQWLHVQRRPPEANSALIAESGLRTERLKPVGLGVARYLVTERTPGQPWRESARAGAYRPLPTALSAQLDFKTSAGRNRVTPTLLYRQSPEHLDQLHRQSPQAPERAPDEPFRLILRHNGAIWFDQWLLGESGQVRLPSVLPSLALVEAQAPSNVAMHINMSGVSNTIADRSRRLVYRIDSQPLEFLLHRTARVEESIGIRWLSDSDADQPAHLKVQILGATRPFSGQDWTLHEREFVIHKAPVGEDYLLGRDTRPVSASQLFYIGIGKDIAPGDYRIRLNLLTESRGYVALSRLSPGHTPARTYLVEKDVDD